MIGPGARRVMHQWANAAGAAVTVAAIIAMGACAQLGEDAGGVVTGAADSGSQETRAPSQTDLAKSAEHWGKELAKNPRDLDAALSYAKSLKALGQKSKALAILQEASLYHGGDKALASEYGRLALELDQLSVAKRLLEAADDPADPDWRIVLARGTVLAKEGQYREAIEFFSRALVLVPNHPSVMNNLALAYTMSGEPGKAEELLRRAAALEGSGAKVRQNLALVLSLQGKYDEAKVVGAEGGDPAAAEANTDLLRRMVKIDPKPMLPDDAFNVTWDDQLAETPVSLPELESATDKRQTPAPKVSEPKIAAAPGAPDGPQAP